MAAPKKKSQRAKRRKIEIQDSENRELIKLTLQADVTQAQKLPVGTVKLQGKDDLVIDVTKLNRSLLRDQRAKLVSSMGCVSNPGGPGC
jgi:hypothetical protein